MPTQPTISVVVPVYNDAQSFQRCLQALLNSAHQPREIIVVDDASTDADPDSIAAENVRVFKLPRRSGPAAARNYGAMKATGDIIFFVDSDVVVPPDSIGRVTEAFQLDPDLVALFGSYDDSPSERNFFSQYKNLFHHFVHQHAKRDASTFWAGCGAIRREDFVRAGRFNEYKYQRPSIEDIELGYRLSAQGSKIVLDKDLQAKHLKRWDFKSLLKADILHRAAPWSRLIFETGPLVNDLNLRLGDRISAGLTWVSIALLLLSFVRPEALLLAFASWFLILLINIRLYNFFLQQRGLAFLVRAFFVHLFYYIYSSITFAVCWLEHVGRSMKTPEKPRTFSCKFVDRRVFTQWDYFAYPFLTLLSLAAVAFFGWHWFTDDGWRLNSWLFILLTLIIGLKLLEPLARWLMLPLMKRPVELEAIPGLKVAVVTTFVASGEPLAMLEKTLAAMVALDYPHDTWVLDEEDDSNVKSLCQRMGAHHFSRRNLPQYQSSDGAFKSHSKHGNYNAWLNEIGFTHYEFLTAFDPDHVPERSFLDRILGYFADPDVGYVQAPAAYYNERASFIARGAAEETYSYYSCTQMAAYALGHPFVNGSHNSHRMTALKQVGGFAAHDADDLWITSLYRDRGWRGVYAPEILARGLVPVDWNGYLRQQIRWARSILDIKFRRFSHLVRSKTIRERLISYLDGVVYLQSSIAFPLLITVLGVMLATGRATEITSSSTLLRFGALGLALQLATFYRQRFFLNPRTEWGFHWRAKLLRYAKWPHVLMAFRDVILKREEPYSLTRKVGLDQPAPSLLWPHWITVIFISASLIAGIAQGIVLHPLWYGLSASVIVGTLILLLTEFSKFPPPYDESQSTLLREPLTLLDREIPVSVVIGTRDRPAELEDCLRCLTAQAGDRALQIIVVDNHPHSRLTPSVVAKFPSVTLINEERTGISYARNAGIKASSGEIIVTVDDDVTMPRDWLEKLLAPFVRPEVTMVSGNVLPFESQSVGAQLFEIYGGLGRGNTSFEVNKKWFDGFRLRTVPTWELGGTANAAFRAAHFKNPVMGMMDEALGPGMPTGVGEDTYLFYRWLKSGATLVYQPSAFVWHKHRQDLPALHRQIYNYSKGHVAYHLTTLFRDRDLRVVPRLLVSLPLTHVVRFLRRLSQPAQHQMLVLTVIEIAGNLVGPWSWWQSRRIVKRNLKHDRATSKATISPAATSLGQETL